MKNKPILIDAGDITVAPIKPRKCEDCETRDATHQIEIELREIGWGSVLFHALCEQCAQKLSKRLKATLPKEVK